MLIHIACIAVGADVDISCWLLNLKMLNKIFASFVCSALWSLLLLVLAYLRKLRSYVAVAYAETFHGTGFIQWHRVVICTWCALFVTSQNDVIVLFPNQRFGEVCWHNMHIFVYIHSSYFMCQCTEYKLLELQVRLWEENTYSQRYDTAVRNCKKYQVAR